MQVEYPRTSLNTNPANNKRILVSIYDQQLHKMKNQNGFIAALDQSGGSTPKALGLYGVTEEAWSNDEEMFAVVHEMRTRIMTSPSFTGERILAAILFENTMDRDVDGRPTADYLWDVKSVVPVLKVDKGLADEAGGVQLMNPMPDLAALLEKAKSKGIFGTKMRSVIKQAEAEGIKAIVAQQFEIGRQISDAGLVPIIEPEVDIHCPDKAAAEALLESAIMDELNQLGDEQLVMLKLTLPEEDNLYKDAIAHANVVRVVALSGGYSREEANARLGRNKGMVASFSRALSEGLNAQQSDDAFNAMLDSSINAICEASRT
jgi:fructose-bisphosphate aldolase class I